MGNIFFRRCVRCIAIHASLFPHKYAAYFLNTPKCKHSYTPSTSHLSIDFADFLNKTMAALRALRPLPILWSPAVTQPFSSYPPQSLKNFKGNLLTLFSHISFPIRVHFQDFLGQSVSFKFPFYYNYTGAFTCEGDTMPYYFLLKEVSAAEPNLEEVKVR